jgi:glycine hydroxymethyltransferase
VIKNAKALAQALIDKDYYIVSGGTDTHLMLIDLSNKEITGKIAERTLEDAGITVNKNMVPFDVKSPFITSGIRIGTPAVTTRGMKEDQMQIIADMIDRILKNIGKEDVVESVSGEVTELCRQFPLYEVPN